MQTDRLRQQNARLGTGFELMDELCILQLQDAGDKL